MKNAETTEQAVEKVMAATNLNASAALAEVKKADATETAAVAPQGAASAPTKISSKKDAGQKKGAAKGKKTAKKAATKNEAKVAPKAKSPAKKIVKHVAGKKDGTAAREGSKTAMILALLNRKQGATLVEIVKATGWQNHSIRGFVSGTLTKKMDLPVESFKNEAGEHTYRVAK